MSAILTAIGSFVSGAINWMRIFLHSITGGTLVNTGDPLQSYSFEAQPILILFVIALPLVGLGIGLLKRLISTRG